MNYGLYKSFLSLFILFAIFSAMTNNTVIMKSETHITKNARIGDNIKNMTATASLMFNQINMNIINHIEIPMTGKNSLYIE